MLPLWHNTIQFDHEILAGCQDNKPVRPLSYHHKAAFCKRDYLINRMLVIVLLF